MATYTGKAVIHGSQAEVYPRLANIGDYQSRLEQLPEELRQRAGEVRFTEDSIIINAAPVGEMRFDVTERRPDELVEFTAANAPVPMKLALRLSPGEEPATTDLRAEMHVEIPAVLKPMIGGKMQEAADRMAQLIGQLFNGVSDR